MATTLAGGTQGNSTRLQYVGNGTWKPVAEANVAAGAIGASQLAANAVQTANIAAGAIGSAQIAPGAITNANLANSHITLNTSGGLTGGATISLGGTANLATNATSANTAGTLVSRDANGNFSARQITATAPTGNFLVMDVEGAVTAGTWLRLNNSTTGGNNWNLISSGSGNGEGAGKLIFNDQTDRF